MFSLSKNILITVFFGLSTFVVTTNCCSCQLTKNIKWDYVSCNDRSDKIMIETIEPIINKNLNIRKETSKENKNFTTWNSLALDQTNSNELLDLRTQGKRSSSIKHISKPHVEKCSQYFDLLFCLNGGRCFNYVIGDSSIISCECAEGYYGERCDFKYTLYDETDLSNSETAPSAIANKCDPDFDLLFCLNGGKCFNYGIGDSSLISCLCPEGYYGERCDFKYTLEEGFVSYKYYSHSHYDGHMIRRAKIYITPFIAGLLISFLLYVIICATFLDSIRRAYKRKFYYNRTKYKTFSLQKMRYFIYFLVRKN